MTKNMRTKDAKEGIEAFIKKEIQNGLYKLWALISNLSIKMNI